MVFEDLEERVLWCWNKKQCDGEELNCFQVSVHHKKQSSSGDAVKHSSRPVFGYIDETFPAESQTLQQPIKEILLTDVVVKMRQL